METKLTGLDLYYQRMREAKAAGPEALKYFKQYYAKKKELAKKTAYIDTGRGFIKKIRINRGPLVVDPVYVSPAKLERHLAKLGSVEAVINYSFGIINEEAAQRMAQYFIEKGVYKPDIQRLKNRQLTKEEWALLEAAYKGKYAENEGMDYGEYFFGS